MLFPTHLVAAYLLALRWDRPSAWTVAGAALPDLVDKPLAMTGLYRLYHSVGHSAVVFLSVTALGLGVALAARALGRSHVAGAPISRLRWVGAAVWLGWASHLALDAVHMPLNGRPGDIRFLAWPLLEHTPAVRLPPLEFALHYVGTPAFFVELLIWAAFVAAVVRRRGRLA